MADDEEKPDEKPVELLVWGRRDLLKGGKDRIILTGPDSQVRPAPPAEEPLGPDDDPKDP